MTQRTPNKLELPGPPDLLLPTSHSILPDARATMASANKGQQANKANKVKPSYKHIPHSQKPPHLVAKRNARERRRVQAVNQAFYKLRKSIPIENRNKRVSKVKTLQRAIDYIRKLEIILSDEPQNNPTELTSQPAQPVASSSHQSTRDKRRKKATNCDSRAANDLDNNAPEPQIMSKQKRARKSSGAQKINLHQSDIISQTTAIDSTITTRHPPLSSSGSCQEMSIHSNIIQYDTQPVQAHKFAEPYYSINNCPPPGPPQAASYQQQPSEILRESSAYNVNTNYYDNNQYHSNYAPPIDPNQSVATSNFDMYTIGTPANHSTNNIYNNFAPLIGGQHHHHPQQSQQHHQQHNQQHHHHHQHHQHQHQHQLHQTAYSVVADSTVYPTVSSAHELNGWQRNNKASELNSSIKSQRTINLNNNQALADSTSGPNITSSSSFELLQSPSSTNSSLATTDSSSANNDNSSTVVCRQKAASTTTSATSNRHQQQVNNYLAYANNRLEARAGHLSFAVNADGPANDNHQERYHNRQHNNNNHHHHQQQQQLDDERESTTELLDGGGLNNKSSQVSHLLNVDNGTLANLGLANNLHAEHHQYQQYHHQQSSFLNNQHQHHVHPSASQAAVQSSTSNNLIHNNNNNNNNQQQQPTIHDYTSLPL